MLNSNLIKNFKILFLILLSYFSISNQYIKALSQENIDQESSFLKNKKFNEVEISKKLDEVDGTEYLLDSGDIINIEFEGVEIFSGNYGVDFNGNLVLPEIDQFKARGKTLKDLNSELNKEYSKFIKEPKISSKIAVFRPVIVFVKGEVQSPGLYQLFFSYQKQNANFKNSYSGNLITQINNISNVSVAPTLFSALQKAQGLTNYADLTKVKIVRKYPESKGGGQITTEINFLDMLLNGDQKKNIKLFDKDVIIIPKSNLLIKEQIMLINRMNIMPSNITIFITGNVEKSGKQDMPKGTTLLQAIASAGGKKLLTGNIEFLRFRDNGTTEKLIFKYNSSAKANTSKNPILMDGDVINVRETLLGNTTKVLREFSSPILSGYGLYKIFN